MINCDRKILLNSLKYKIENSLKNSLIGLNKFALLDFPDYSNIGDSAIYCGEIDFFKSKKLKPSYCSTTQNYNQNLLNAAIDDGPIFMHGGGNFGTLWKWFQPFREEVLRTNVGRQIIQLPQTIHYSSQDEIDKTARVIDTHGNYILLVRDQKSYDIAYENFQCKVILCPDMAFAMNPIRRLPADSKILFHLREDQEAAGDYDTSSLVVNKSAIRFDWPEETVNLQAKVRKSILLPLLLAGLRGGRQGYRERRYRGLASYRLGRGIELLSRGEKVVTDRLHGHILCYLMDIPHCVIDNSYGKTSSFMEAWGTGGGNVYRADTIAEAVSALS